jgi:predicted Zn-dependent protease
MKNLFISTFLLVKSICIHGQSVNIYRVNECDYKDLELVKSTVQNQYGYVCKIYSNQYYSKNKEFIDSDSLNYVLFERKYFNLVNHLPISIFVSKSKILSEGKNVCGVSFGNQIYISSRVKDRIQVILVHEISHSLGLNHCQNVCIMNPQYNPKFIPKIWNFESDRPIYCSDCQNQLK